MEDREMEKRFEFVIGIEDKQEDSTSFQYLTTKQMKAISVVLKIAIEAYHDEKGEEFNEVELFPCEDDTFITEKFFTELMGVVKNSINETYKNDPNKNDAIEDDINIIESSLKQIDELP